MSKIEQTCVIGGCDWGDRDGCKGCQHLKITISEPISIAIDFDGTLVEDKFPAIGEEKPKIVALVKELQQLGVRTVLWTCRNGDMLPPAIEWCEQHDLHFDAVNENLPEVKEKWGGDTRKVMTDYYFDDKNLGGLDRGMAELYVLKSILKHNKG